MLTDPEIEGRRFSVGAHDKTMHAICDQAKEANALRAEVERLREELEESRFTIKCLGGKEFSMKKMLCKFRVSSVEPHLEGHDERSVSHACVDDTNTSWAAATPAGQLSLTIHNPKAMGILQPGTEFWLEITTIDKDAPR